MMQPYWKNNIEILAENPTMTSFTKMHCPRKQIETLAK
jgi:hypothetical protein